MSRFDLPCPWCRGRYSHVLGCPSPDDDSDKRWDSRRQVHELLMSYGTTEDGVRWMALLEPPELVAQARELAVSRGLAWAEDA